MAALELPYPVVVGRLEAGQWSSQVPDRLRFEGRVGVRVGESVAGAKAAFEEVVRGACPEAEISWGGGKFAPAETPTDHPLVEVVGTALARELGRPPELCGFPGGADTRLFTARGIPCVSGGRERHRTGARGEREGVGRGCLQTGLRSSSLPGAVAVWRLTPRRRVRIKEG
jgi:acetylornithine deacetylase